MTDILQTITCICDECGTTTDKDVIVGMPKTATTCSPECSKKFWAKQKVDLYNAWEAGLTENERSIMESRTERMKLLPAIEDVSPGVMLENYSSECVIGLKEKDYTPVHADKVAYNNAAVMTAETAEKGLAKRKAFQSGHNADLAIFNRIPLGSDTQAIFDFMHNAPEDWVYALKHPAKLGGVYSLDNLMYVRKTHRAVKNRHTFIHWIHCVEAMVDEAKAPGREDTTMQAHRNEMKYTDVLNYGAKRAANRREINV